MAGSCIKVLLVEDNPGDVRLLQEFLYDVTTATEFKLFSAEFLGEALKYLENESFDAILLDLSLPDSQGLETFMAIHQQTPSTPIIVLTGIADENLAIKAMQQGAQDYLVKGQVSGELLARCMRYAIERQRAEEALRQSESVLRSFYNSAAAMLGIVELLDNDILFISCNATAAEFFGLSKEKMQNRKASEIGASQSEINFWIEHYEEAKNTQTPVNFQIPRKTSQGLRWFSAIASAIPTHPRARSRFSFIIEDITERKLAEEKIREQAALLDIATDAILVRDLNNKILFWNKGAENIYGWRREEACGQNSSELLYKEQLQELETALLKTIATGNWQGELTKVTKTGKSILVESRWTLVRDAHGKPSSILVVDTDITEKKQLQSQFFRAQRLESIGTLASGIAHDLNNILTPIIIGSQMLPVKFPNADERTQNLFQLLQDSGKRGAELIKQVLSFARGVEGKRITLQPRHLIRDVVKILQQTFPKSIEVYIDIAQDLWTVHGDSTQLHQVLMNLCVNARDAMTEGGILNITAENVYIDSNYASMNLDAKVGAYTVISIADTGCGISPEIIDRIFEPFFTTKELGKGTGLGLSTVIGIIKSHGGFVNVYSEVGSGTQFKVYLPADQEAEIQEISQDLEPLSGNGELILVVDDEVYIQEITETSLEPHNYKTLSASDGIEAIALYARRVDEISVVLMDMMLPLMDGLTAIRTLQKINPNVKIIATSGLGSNRKVAEASSSGVKTFLAKPYTVKELLSALQSVLN